MSSRASGRGFSIISEITVLRDALNHAHKEVYSAGRNPTSYSTRAGLSVGGGEHGFTRCSPPVVAKAPAYLGTSCPGRVGRPDRFLETCQVLAPYLSMITRT